MFTICRRLIIFDHKIADISQFKRYYEHKVYQIIMDNSDDNENHTSPFNHLDIRDAVNSKLVKFRKEHLKDVKMIEHGWNNYITHNLCDLKPVTMNDFILCSLDYQK